MRILFMLAGIPGSGKSYSIKQLQLEHLTLSTDTLRVMNGTLLPYIDKSSNIDSFYDNIIFEQLMQMLENRMIYGQTTILDTTGLYDINDILDMAKAYRTCGIGSKELHHTASPQMIAVVRSMQNKYEEQIASGYQSAHQINYMPAGKTDVKITKENLNTIFFETVNAANRWDGAYKITFDQKDAQELYNIVKTVIDNGADINARDENGKTMILSLLEINSNAQSNNKSSCSSKGYWQTVNYVLEHNPDLTIKDNLGVGVMDHIDFIFAAGEKISAQNIALLRRVSDKYEQQVNTNTHDNVQTQTGNKTLNWEKALDMSPSR